MLEVEHDALNSSTTCHNASIEACQGKTPMIDLRPKLVVYEEMIHNYASIQLSKTQCRTMATRFQN